MAWSLTAFLVLIIGSFVSFVAKAYPTPIDINGNLMRWERSPDNPVVTYAIEAEAGVFAASFLNSLVASAAQKWSAVPGSFISLAPVMPGAIADITIRFKGSLTSSSFSSGFAIFDELDDEGLPKHCTIEVLSQISLGFFSIAKTILHEMGHCLGLGHSLVPQAIMSYSLDKNKFALDFDDSAAILRLYSLNPEEKKLPPGCAVVGGENIAKIPISIIFLIPLIFFLERKRWMRKF